MDCGITNSMLSCTPSVDGISLSTITGLHRGNIFVPQLPVAMGQISNVRLTCNKIINVMKTRVYECMNVWVYEYMNVLGCMGV